MKNVLDSLQNLKNLQNESAIVYKPAFFRLTKGTDLQKFREVLLTPGITVLDHIREQIQELLKFLSPERKFSTDELEKQTKIHLGDFNLENYGVWVYYSWSNRLVHILDEEEFVTVRTSRNQYKITPEEKEILAKKKVGVVGLSVGQAVSVTLAMERICGELRLADFDILELTNLNRIRTGIHNLGLPKVYSVAREIAEIDPFLKVICFPDGLTENNMEEFFTIGGKLDLLVEESDGFDIKILCRYKARELGIPVIMEGSDRCLVDVERFDLEPKRSILHGLVDHLDIDLLRTLKTNEEKIPYMLDILGLESASLRLKASMLEIDQTINTWPQLASAVTMGGGITADVCRRMLLNHYTESGRYHIDIEELIGNKKNLRMPVVPGRQPMHDCRDLAAKFEPKSREGQISLSKEQITEIVSAGCKAPSGGNSQPWRWIYKSQSLLLFNGLDGSSSMLGFDNLASYVALGAAAQNVLLKAEGLGFNVHYEFFPDPKIKDLVMLFSFMPKKDKGKGQTHLLDAIDLRLTNRMLGQRQRIEAGILERLQTSAAEIPGIHLHFYTADKELDRIANLLGELEKIRLLEEMGHRDFVEEIRWTEEENNEKKDGIDLRTLDLTPPERVGLEVARDQEIIHLLKDWKGGGAFKKLTRKSIDSAGAVGVITANSDDRESYLKGGLALERIWLNANSNGISFQPMASSVFIYARLLKGNGAGLSSEGIKKLKTLRPVFEQTFGIANGRQDIFIFRLSKSAEPEIKSLRKPLEELFFYL